MSEAIKRDVMTLWKANEKLISMNFAKILSEVPYEEKQVKSALNSLVRGKYLSSESKGKCRYYFLMERKYHYVPESQRNKEFIFEEDSLLRVL